MTTSVVEVLTGAVSTIIGTVEFQRISWAKTGWPVPQLPRTEPANAVTSPAARVTSCTVRVPEVVAHWLGAAPSIWTRACVAVADSLMSYVPTAKDWPVGGEMKVRAKSPVALKPPTVKPPPPIEVPLRRRGRLEPGAPAGARQGAVKKA